MNIPNPIPNEKNKTTKEGLENIVLKSVPVNLPSVFASAELDYFN